MNRQPVFHEHCQDCGTEVEVHGEDARCPACFEKYLFDIDAGFLESYRRFGCRSRLVVAETCLRGLVTDSPEHRKVLAMTIFEQYVHSMNDLVGLFSAFQNRQHAPIVQSFLEFKLDAPTAMTFFDSVRRISDQELVQSLDLPMPMEVMDACPQLSPNDAYEVAVALHHLVTDLRKATDQGELAAMALAQFAGQGGAAVLANDAKWLNGHAGDVSPDQVAMMVLDSKRRSIYVQGLTADEGAMGQVVDAIDTVTRAASNLIYAYLQVNDL